MPSEVTQNSPVTLPTWIPALPSVASEGFLAQGAEAAETSDKALGPHPHPSALPGCGTAVWDCRNVPQAAESVLLCRCH